MGPRVIPIFNALQHEADLDIIRAEFLFRRITLVSGIRINELLLYNRSIGGMAVATRIASLGKRLL